jgi:hypothetical protein
VSSLTRQEEGEKGFLPAVLGEQLDAVFDLVEPERTSLNGHRVSESGTVVRERSTTTFAEDASNCKEACESAT